MQSDMNMTWKLVTLQQHEILMAMKMWSHSCEASNFVSEPLGLDNCNLLCHSLVGVEIKSKPVVILLYDDS